MGRPTDSPKKQKIEIRIDEDTLNKLDECVKINKSNRSKEIRDAITDRYDTIKK